MLGMLIFLVLLGSARCEDGKFDQRLCKNCAESDNFGRVAGGITAPGDKYRYAAAIYKKGVYMVQNENKVEVDRNMNYSIYCSAAIINSYHAVTSYACSVTLSYTKLTDASNGSICLKEHFWWIACISIFRWKRNWGRRWSGVCRCKHLLLHHTQTF